MSVESELTSKRARGRAKGDRELEELMLKDVLPWHGLDSAHGARWPRPRAPLALDIFFSSTGRNPPKVHTATKRLLDILGGQVGEPVAYQDDRQVKMLFARTFPDSERSQISVTAQTLTSTLAGVRRAISLDHPWRPERASHSRYRDLDPDPLDEDLASWYKDDPSEHGQEWYLRLTFEERLSRQSRLLTLTDRMSAHVVTSYASERETRRFQLPGTSNALSYLLASPLAVDLGQLPTRGQSTSVRKRVTAELIALATNRPGLFPLLSTTGITIFYVEGGDGKDLDNIFLDLLPPIVEHLQLPEREISPWAPLDQVRLWDAALKDQTRLAAPGVSFIEAIAIQNVPGMAMAPANVVMALSHGARYESWWGSAVSNLGDGFKDFDEFDD